MSVDMLAAEGCIEGSESFSYGTILLEIKEVAGAGAHLALGLFYKEGLGYPDISRVLFDSDGCDVTGKESVVGSDCECIHIFLVLYYKLPMQI